MSPIVAGEVRSSIWKGARGPRWRWPRRAVVRAGAVSSTGGRGGRTPAYDGLAQTWFESTDAMRRSAETPEYRATRDDERNFVAGERPRYGRNNRHVRRQENGCMAQLVQSRRGLRRSIPLHMNIRQGKINRILQSANSGRRGGGN